MVFIGGIILVAFVFFAVANALFFSEKPSAGRLTGNVPLPGSGDAQVVYLSVQGGNYVLSQSTVQANRPVRFVADPQKLPGCSRSIAIPQFGIRKVFSASDNTLEFTPTQKGPLTISCSMGMYKTTVNVV